MQKIVVATMRQLITFRMQSSQVSVFSILVDMRYLRDMRANFELPPFSSVPDVPAQDFLNSVRKDVCEYTATFGKGRHGQDKRCALCPRRNFDSATRVLSHIREYHTADQKFCPSGTKQLKTTQALYDHDRTCFALGGGYLKRSAAMLSAAVDTTTHTRVDDAIVLVQDVGGPRFISRRQLGDQDLRRVNDVFFTHALATAVYRDALLHDGCARQVAAAAVGRSQLHRNEPTSLVPRSNETWLAILENIFFAPQVNADLARLMEGCLDAGEFDYISIDGTMKACLPLMGQAKFTDPLQCATPKRCLLPMLSAQLLGSVAKQDQS